MKTALQERRKFPRAECPSRVAIYLVEPRASLVPQSINISRGGLCLRVQDRLEVNSLLRFQLTQGGAGQNRGQQSVECTGRVAWIIQRLDLRDNPPFLFDVGIEFVESPPMLRQLLAQRGGALMGLKERLVRARTVEPSTIRGRCFTPRLEREANHALRWHLVVSVDGTPCFSGHYASERSALAAWAKFKRQQAKR